MSMPARSSILFLLAWLLPSLWLASSARGQTPRLGQEAQVNAFTTGFQFFPAVADDGRGGNVVVWMSETSPQDDSSYSIRGRRLATGRGDELQINDQTAGGQRWPAVSMTPDGAFIVVWASPGDGSGESIQGRRFDALGTPLAGQFQVNDYTTGAQSYPAVASRADGDFVVVWSSLGSGADDQITYSIQGRRFASDGSALGAAFQVNAYTTGDQDRPVVRWASDDHFVVVWTSQGSGGDDSSGRSIQGRLFASDGSALTSDLQLNTFTSSQQNNAVLAVAEGDILVVWSSVGSSGDDTDQSSVQGRLLASDLTFLGDQFQINDYTTGFQIAPSVAALAAGGFVVVWESLGSPGDDTSDRSIQGQELNASGLGVGEQFQINTWTSSYQLLPRVAADRQDGDYLVVWNSAGSFGDDSDFASVQGQRFGRRLFADGFESGDLTPWSNSTP